MSQSTYVGIVCKVAFLLVVCVSIEFLRKSKFKNKVKEETSNLK